MDNPYIAGRSSRFSVKRVRGDEMPSRCIAVACDAIYEDGDKRTRGASHTETQFGRLLEWYATAWRREQGHDCKLIQERGCTPAAFWSWIYKRLAGGGTWWLFAYDLYPLLCLVKFFDEIDNGELSLCLSEEDNGGMVNFARKRKRQGLLIAENPPTLIIVHRKGGGVLKLIDLANYSMTPSATPDSGLDARAHGVMSDYRLLASFVANNGLGALQHTAAAQGFYYYRKSHMAWPVEAHPFKCAIDLERAAHYGGRCELARLGEIDGQVYHMDVNAQYTRLALTSDFPARFLGYNDNPPMDDALALIEEGGAIADVTVRIREPVAPIRTRERTLFPVGIFRTTLCQPELELAVRYGEIVRVHQLALYTMMPLLQTFAKAVTSLRVMARQIGSDNMLSFTKAMANGFYGKWGQRSKRWVTVDGRENPERWEAWWEPHPKSDDPVCWRAIAGIVQYQDCEVESKLAVPAISAFMCSYGRAYLWRVIEAAGIDNVYYWDTDSVMCNQEGFDRLRDGQWLCDETVGKLKVREASDMVELIGVKHYIFGERYCCSGVSQRTEEVLHGSCIVSEHVGFGAGLWHRERGVSRRIARKVARRRKYSQGRVLRDGRVVPYQFTCRSVEKSDNDKNSI